MNAEWNRALEHAATECREVSMAQLLLSLGELSASERRAVRAALDYMATRILALKSLC